MIKEEEYEESGFVIRIRGLPWSATQDDVANFLQGSYGFGRFI